MNRRVATKLLAAERARVEALLLDLADTVHEERVSENESIDPSDAAEPLTSGGVDAAVTNALLVRLAALSRAQARIEEGTFGRSVLSGDLIPEERLIADPAAELTFAEAARATMK